MRAHPVIKEDSEYQARTLLALAELFYRDPANQAAFEAWMEKRGENDEPSDAE